MNPVLENSFYRLVIDPDRAVWSLAGREDKSPGLEGVRTGLDYRSGRERGRLLGSWSSPLVSGPHKVNSPHGALRQLTVDMEPDRLGMRCQLIFALPEEQPLLLWKLAVENRGPGPVYLDRFTLLQAGSPWDSSAGYAPGLPSRITFLEPTGLQSPTSALRFFSNGWQSWSYTGSFAAKDRFRRTRLGFFREPTDAGPGTPRPSAPGHFASDMFGVLGDAAQRSAVLAGFLSQCQHFGSLETWIDRPAPGLELWANGDGARLDPGAHISTDWACLCFLNVDDPDPLGPYLEAVAREHGLPAPLNLPGSQNEALFQVSRSTLPPTPTGWCSWYQYSSENYVAQLSAQDIRRNLEGMIDLRRRLPLEILQIDDGFEAQVGDWFDFSPAFPDGVAPLADEIRAAGFTPGLWLSPFIVHSRSRLAADHPGWLLRGRYNRPVNAGYLWDSFATALDLTHPAALEYASQAVHTAVHCWGFPYLKLDFLYAAALPGRRHDPTRTRAQTLRAGLEALRAAAGEDAVLLGCGCPLGPAIGLVNAMRIGADTARRWYPSFNSIEKCFRREPNLPSARNALHNTLTRSPLHRRWWVNDPDCLLLRPQTSLTLDEVRTAAATIALTGGSLLLSDDLAALPPDRIRIAEMILPLLDRRPRVLDWFDSDTPSRLRLDLENSTGVWHLVALYNWIDQPRDLTVHLEEFDLDPQANYYAREFWNSDLYRISKNSLPTLKVPAHGVILLAVRPILQDQPLYLGSDLHISQGLEVAEWRPALDGLHLCLKRPAAAQGHFDLRLPRPPVEALLDGVPVQWRPIAAGCYRFYGSFVRTGLFDLRFE